MYRDTTAILDNSSFGGVMRLYEPNLESHRDFLDRYPEHKYVDQVSLADLLTALCTFDTIMLESSSRASLYNSGDVQNVKSNGRNDEYWVDSLLALLPSDIRNVFYAAQLTNYKEVIKENDKAQKLAFDIFTSELSELVELKNGEKLPDVYTSKSYAYLNDFIKLNQSSEIKLDSNKLSQAMFLHRGLYLQAHAQKNSATYIPYLYRGRMISSLPPLYSTQINNDEIKKYFLNNEPMENKNYLKEINRFYYQLLNKLTWTTCEDRIPFIGASIIAKANGCPKAAIEIAMEIREKGDIKKAFRDLEFAIDTNDKVIYDIYLDEIKIKLKQASMHVGDNSTNPYLKTFYKLATFWVPKGAKEALDSIVELTSPRLRHRANHLASHLLKQNSFQVLFIDHVNTIRS